MIPGPLTKLVATPQNTYQPFNLLTKGLQAVGKTSNEVCLLQKYPHFKGFLPVLLSSNSEG